MVASIYEGMPASDRLARTIEAMAANDAAESRRLWSTCPRRLYEMTDANFSDQIDGASDLAIIVSGDLRSFVARIHVVELFITLLTTAKKPSRTEIKVQRVAVRLANRLAAEFISTWRALDSFCAERMDTTAAALIGAWCPPHLPQFLAVMKGYPRAKPSADDESAYHAMLTTGWCTRFGEAHNGATIGSDDHAGTNGDGDGGGDDHAN